MDNSRNFIIERLKSKQVTIDEFNFDKLSAPPLAMFFSPQDIWELNGIAKSIKLSGKLQQKLQMIDIICKRRGLIKFGSGTNRVVYRHPEFNQFVFKIAYDNVALMDNINEFKNQYILKPFVAKTFEVSPCGTVAISERVKPITSREEFISIADDVFTLLNEFIIGKYIMSDIGSQYFCNFGIRVVGNFGPVILDYSFLYELDENKIYCNKPDPNSPSGLCEGEIGYDDGFNHLYCSKCGAKYKAIELKKKIKDNEIIVQRQGDIKMKINFRGGSTNTNKSIETNTINNDNFMNTMESVVKRNPRNDKRANSSNKIVISLGKQSEEQSLGLKIKSVNKPEPIKEPVVEPVVEKAIKESENFAVNGVSVSSSPVTKNDIDKFIDSLPDDEPVVEKTAEKYESPISFDKSLIKETNITAPVKSPVEVIDEAVETIIENLNNISIDIVKDDAVSRMIEKIVNVIPANGKAFRDVIEVAVSIFDNAEDDDYLDVVHSEKFVKFIQRIFDLMVVNSDVERDGDDLVVTQNIDVVYAYDHEDVAFKTESEKVKIEGVFLGLDEGNEKSRNTKDEYNGIEFANGLIVNSNQLFPAADNEEIIVGVDENGDYITTGDGNIIAINTINDCEINTVDIVSKEWIKSVNKMIDEASENEISENTIGVAQVTEE